MIEEDVEIYPFMCNKCHGIWDCDVIIEGLCICPICEDEKYNAELKAKLRI